MIKTPHVDWFALSPELALLGAAGLALLAAVLVPAARRKQAGALLSGGGFVGAFVAAALLYGKTPGAGISIVGDAMRRDRFGAVAAMIVAAVGAVVTLVSYDERKRDDHVAEYFAMLMAAGAGMIFLASAFNLMTLFLGLEWFSIALYVMTAIDADKEGSLEAGLKYLVVGSVGSAVLLFGSALVYGATGQLSFDRIAQAVGQGGLSGDVLLASGLAMILAGLGFKASAAPFHQWTPDVYEGAPTPVTAFMSAATKTVAFVLTLRVLVTAFPQEKGLWTIALAVLAVGSLAIGNLAALVQRDLKRMLAYSSVSHAGFMLIPLATNSALGARALLYYLIPYTAMSVGAFAVLAARERELGEPVTVDNLGGFGWERPLLGVALATFVLGFAGFPLTGGFVGKFYALSAAYDRGWVWLVVIGVIATLVSLYYYLGVVRSLYMRGSAVQGAAVAVGGSPPRDGFLQAAVVVCLVVTVGSFFAAQPLVDIAKHAVGSLPF